MRIGVVYPQSELQGDPDTVRRLGRAVEDLGFDHLSTHEHVLGVVYSDDRAPGLYEGPYTERHPYHDPFVMFAYLAGITEHIEFATGVLVLPQRQTALVARQATDLALLSGGRLRLGVGAGWNHVEFEALGQGFADRGPRQEEQIDVLRRLFDEPVVDYSGRFHRIDRAALLPKPARPIPIWLGGSSKIAFDRAARLADGFIFDDAQGIDSDLEAWNRLRGHLERAGRSERDFGREFVAGATENVHDLPAQFDAWREAGGTHATIAMEGLGLRGVDGHIDYIAAAADVLGLRAR